MKWAGPRMTLRHPILALLHVFDGRRPAPVLPAKTAQRAGASAPSQPAAKK